MYSASGVCVTHAGEYLKAVCVTPECASEHQVLCCECLIAHDCNKKMKITEFIAKFKSVVNRERLEILLELFEVN